MSSIAKLKKEAADLEQRRLFDKALAKYQQLLDLIDEEPEEADVALFNRVGDLMLRQGNVGLAVSYYERAVDLYTDGGFFNNAIALCNKILRNAPGRSVIYYKLGRISAKKGFVNDAKQNFLEYADRMRKGGQLDEAFRALKEFADLCPDQDDIRMMLADQLVRDGRTAEAIDQLQLLYEKFLAEGREGEARETVTRMKAIDPDAEPRAGTGLGERKRSSLVFLDVHDDSAWLGSRSPTPAYVAPVSSGRDARRDTPGSYTPHGLPLIVPDELDDVPAVAGIEHGAGFADAIEEDADAATVEGLEHASFEADAAAATEAVPVAEIEHTLLAEQPSLAHDLLAVPEEEPLELIHPEPDLDMPEPGSGYADDLPDGGEIVLFDDAESRPPLLGDPSSYGDAGRPDVLGGDIFAIESEPLVFVTADPDLGTPAEPEDPVATLRAELEASPGDTERRRRLGELLIERGEREAGLAELDEAMTALERAGDLSGARSIAEEIVRVNPDAVRLHQKRVEYAFRTADRVRLVDAYLDLGDALVRGGELSKARSVYGRVYELAPDDPRAQVAMETTAELTGEHLRQPTPPRSVTPSEPSAARAPATPEPLASEQHAPPSAPAPRAAAEPAAPAPSAPGAPRAPVPTSAPSRTGTHDRAGDASGFVDLADWLREDETPKSTRMVAADVHEPVDGQDADFHEMLERFKQGVAANLDESDHESHYDLGVAYREMGLLDEAIGEFQKALRANGDRIRTYEALGQCFVDKGQFQIAVALLTRALDDATQGDDTLIGVLYLLGISSQTLRRWDDARGFFERVFAVDIGFRDVGARLAAVEGEGARA